MNEGKMKNTDTYFEKARSLPLAVSITDVQSLIQLKGVIKPPVKNAWWNLNNIIIMTTTLAITAAVIYSLSPVSESQLPIAHEETIIEVEPLKNETLVSEQHVIYQHETQTEEALNPMQNEKKEIVAYVDSMAEDQFISEMIAETKLIEQEINQELVLPNTVFNSLESEILAMVDDTAVQTENLDEFEVVAPKVSEATIEGNLKTISKEISMEGIEWLKLSNNGGDIDIKNWEEPKIALVATIEIEGKNDEDVKQSLEDFKLDLLKKGNKVVVNHNFEEFDNCRCWPSRKNKFKTSKGNKVKIDKVEITYELKVPKEINLDVKNNYGNISIDDVNGELIASLFKGNLNAGSIKGKVNLNERYGEATIKSFQTGKIVLFQAGADLGKSDEVDLKANYSKVKMGETNKLLLSSFQSNISGLNKIQEIQGSLKYGDLDLEENVEIVTLNLFQANLNLKDVKHLELNSSYSKIKGENATTCNLENAFQTKLRLNKVDEITGSARYTPIELELLTNRMDLNTFQGNVKVREVDASFKSLELESRYSDIKLNFNAKSKLNLDAKTAYTSVNFPKNIIDVDFQNKSGNYRNDFKGSYGSSDSSNSSKVIINSFQGNLTLDVIDAKASLEKGRNYKYEFTITPETSSKELDSLILLLENYKLNLQLFDLVYDENERIDRIDGVIKYGASSGGFTIDQSESFEALALKFKPGLEIEIR